MKKTIAVLALLAAGAAMTAPASAGQKSVSSVTVSYNADRSGIGAGAFGDARNSTDSLQDIEVRTFYSQGSTTYLVVYAEDATGNAVIVSSSDPAILAVAATITQSSQIRFAWDASSTLTMFNVFDASLRQPPVP
jgi:hypothetical protein